MQEKEKAEKASPVAAASAAISNLTPPASAAVTNSNNSATTVSIAEPTVPASASASVSHTVQTAHGKKGYIYPFTTSDKCADSLRSMDVKRILLPPFTARLPLQNPHNFLEAVNYVNCVQDAVNTMRETAGEEDPENWHKEWGMATQRLVLLTVREGHADHISTQQSIRTICKDLKDKLQPDANSLCELSGPDGLKFLVNALLRDFTKIKPASIPSMIRQYSVTKDTAFSTWLRDFKRLADGASCFEGANISNNELKLILLDCLESQFPHYNATIDKDACETYADVMAINPQQKCQ